MISSVRSFVKLDSISFSYYLCLLQKHYRTELFNIFIAHFQIYHQDKNNSTGISVLPVEANLEICFATSKEIC